MTHMGLAIKNTFDVLNLNRMQSGKRSGWIEPAVQTGRRGGGGQDWERVSGTRRRECT